MTKYRKIYPFFLLLVLAILVAGLTALPNAVLADEMVTQDAVCIPAAYAQAGDAQMTFQTEVANPRIEPPGSTKDAAWPIVKEWTELQIDSTGVKMPVNYVLRRNPNPLPASQTSVLSTSCTFAADESLTSSQTIQGITQNLKSFFYRYNWVSGSQNYKAYWIYKTQEYWTRTSTSYTLGQNATNWTNNGWDCSNAFLPNSASGGFVPSWSTSTQTNTYTYDITKNWSTKTPGPNLGSGLIKTRETTPAYKSGSSIGTLTTEVRLWGE